MVNIPLNEIELFDFEKYKNDGWGLSRKEFELIFQQFTSWFAFNNEVNVVEFGSGRSTEFLVDLINRYNIPVNIYSFDDSIEYAYKGTHPNLKLHIVPLVECSDGDFRLMFQNKKYDSSKMKNKTSPVHTRQTNTFYKVEDSMLPDRIDLMIVDGPHGNGRSLAYLRCIDRLVEGSTLLIDDASHYPFYDHLKLLIDVDMCAKQHERHNKWESGGDFILCRVRK